MPSELNEDAGSPGLSLNDLVITRFVELSRASAHVSAPVADAIASLTENGTLSRAQIFAAVMAAVERDIAAAAISRSAEQSGGLNQ